MTVIAAVVALARILVPVLYRMLTVVVLYYDSRDEALLVFARDYPYLYLVFAAYQANRVQTEVVTEVDNIIV